MSESEAMLIGRILRRHERRRQVQNMWDNATATVSKKGNIGHLRPQTQAPGSPAVAEN